MIKAATLFVFIICGLLLPQSIEASGRRSAYEEQIRRYEQRQAHKQQRQKIRAITEIDISTFNPQPPTQLEQFCLGNYEPTAVTKTGKRVKMLGVSFVNMDRSQGASAWGHVAERFIYCLEDEYRDDLFEYLPLKDGAIDQLASDLMVRYGFDYQSLSEDYRRSLVGSLYVGFTSRPLDGRYQDLQLDENRTVYEAWFQGSELDHYKMLLNNSKRWNDQMQAVRLEQPLPRYHLLKNNCTTPVAEDIEILNPAFLQKHHLPFLTPTFAYNFVKKMPLDKIVVYPSQRLYRLLELKEQGRSILFENFAPLSKASQGARRGWVLYYPDSIHPERQMLIRPIAGVINLSAALVETAYGLVTLPLEWLSKVKGFHKLKSDKRGWKRVRSGLNNVLWSASEVAFLRVRYPSSTDWTEDEREFIRGLEQTSVFVKYLQSEHSL